MQKAKKTLLVVWMIYLLCYVFRMFEYFILRTDRTWVGEAIVHKLTGIMILFVAARLLQVSMPEIGFEKEGCLRNLIKGLLFGIGVFIVAYSVEILIAVSKGNFKTLQIYVSSYAVNQNVRYKTELLFFLICIVGNIVNVVMEEGIFRGLFEKILEKRYSFIISALIASSLFGLWHVIGPVRNYFDRSFGLNSMIANAIMLLITSALVGFKFALLTKMTGSLYMAMGDHFVNNTIVNILHVVSDSGADEMMFVRITIAQTISFLLVLIRFIHLSQKER